MATPPLTDAAMREIIDAVRRHGTITAAASALGMPLAKADKRFRLACAAGHKDPRKISRPAAEFEVTAPPLPEGEPVEELIARRKAAFARKAASRESKNLIPVRVNIEGAYGVLHMGDPHVDDDGCDWPTLERHIHLIDETPGLFAANVGDLSNNWIGRLARLYGSQGTSAADAVRMVEWLVKRLRWLYLVGGNHDVWSGKDDPIRWFATQAGLTYEWHGVRLGLTSPNGREVRINARHDFAGTSQWNGAHAPAKAARMGWERDHIYTCGHRHMAAHNTIVMDNGSHVAHAIRVGTYKVFDDYSDAKGFPKENLPAAVTVVNPDARDAVGLVTVFWDVEAAADYLRFLRRRAGKRAA